MIKSAVKEYIFDINENAPSCHASTLLPLFLLMGMTAASEIQRGVCRT